MRSARRSIPARIAPDGSLNSTSCDAASIYFEQENGDELVRAGGGGEETPAHAARAGPRSSCQDLRVLMVDTSRAAA